MHVRSEVGSSSSRPLKKMDDSGAQCEGTTRRRGCRKPLRTASGPGIKGAPASPDCGRVNSPQELYG
ncbi:hypothetical protein ACOMHN_021045 [Nucella lapillus]